MRRVEDYAPRSAHLTTCTGNCANLLAALLAHDVQLDKGVMHTEEIKRQGTADQSAKIVKPQPTKETEKQVERPLEPHWVALIDGATD